MIRAQKSPATLRRKVYNDGENRHPWRSRGALADLANPALPRISHHQLELKTDGAQLCLQITLPRSCFPKNVTILVHGFCGDKSENGLFDVLAERISSAGGAVVRYDWRGTGASTGDFLASDLGQHVDDFCRIAQWVTKEDGLHLGRDLAVNSVGFSLGAAIVGLGLARGIPLSRVSYLSPATRPNLSMWPRYDNQHIRESIQQRGFAEKEDTLRRFGMRMLESLRDTDLGEESFSLQVPLLVCYGTNDARILPKHTEDLIRARANPRCDFWAMPVGGASHSFRPGNEYWPKVAEAVAAFTVDGKQPGGRK